VNQLIKEGILYSPKPNQLKRVISWFFLNFIL
jgi:hypothetical protein